MMLAGKLGVKATKPASVPWFVYLGLNRASDVKADPSSDDALIFTFTPEERERGAR
jgi:hypothetical protein